MDYGKQLARELSETEDYARWRENLAPVRPAMTPRDMRQVAILRQEVMQIAALVYLNASLANWQASHPQATLPCKPQAFKPRPSMMATAALTAISDTEACFELLQFWQNFAARLSFAVSLSEALAQDEAPRVAAPAAAELWADAWRRAATALQGVHRAIHGIMHAQGVVAEPQQEAAILAALQSSAQGGWPCISKTGDLQVPGWAERRSATRLPAAGRLQLMTDTGAIQAILLDVSATGLKFEIEGRMRSDESLIVELPNQQRLAGTVVWAIANRIGVRLTAPLTDDLMRQLSRLDNKRS